MRSSILVAATALVLPAALGAVATPASAHAAPRCNGHVATIVGTAGHDTIHGTPGRDVIVGLGGRDDIAGRGGRDIICGGSGADTIDGGPGNDVIHGQAGADTLAGGKGNDHLIGNKGDMTTFVADAGNDVMSSHTDFNRLDYRKAPSGITADLPAHQVTGWGRDTVPGQALSTTVLGSTHDDTMIGTAGQDVLEGEGGTDTIRGNGGGDALSADAGSLDGGAGSDVLTSTAAGGAHTLDMSGGPGPDTLQSHNPGQLLAGPGDDEIDWDNATRPFPAGLVLDGADGRDKLWLPGDTAAPATVVADMGTGALRVDGVDVTASGFELFEANLGDSSAATTYDVTGTDGPDYIYLEGKGTSTIHALGGDDEIHTTDGDDLIFGGLGNDTADGAAGHDTCTSVEHPSHCEVVNP